MIFLLSAKLMNKVLLTSLVFNSYWARIIPRTFKTSKPDTWYPVWSTLTLSRSWKSRPVFTLRKE